MSKEVADPTIPLAGGRTTPGVVRVGDTAHRLLRHLEAEGFDGAPQFLGRDGDGRNALCWIQGDVPTNLSAARSDAVLAAVARLIRQYHEAAAALPTAPAAARPA